MRLKILSLNCQMGYQPGLEAFLSRTLKSGTYDFLLLQEVTEQVLGLPKDPSYRFVRAFNDEIGAESQLCIAYRGNYPLLDQGFFSFASMRKDPMRGFKHPAFAMLCAEFDVGGMPMRFGSVHLHSGMNEKVRRAELMKVKELLSRKAPMPTFFSGDFNAGYPREATRMARLLSPEFAWASRDIGPTLDSRFSENAPHLPNRISRVLAVFNIGIPLWTDQVFADRESAERHDIRCRVLPDRVSDHSPVELSIQMHE